MRSEKHVLCLRMDTSHSHSGSYSSLSPRWCSISRSVSSNASSRLIAEAFQVRSHEEIQNPSKRYGHESWGSCGTVIAGYRKKTKKPLLCVHRMKKNMQNRKDKRRTVFAPRNNDESVVAERARTPAFFALVRSTRVKKRKQGVREPRLQMPPSISSDMRYSSRDPRS